MPSLCLAVCYFRCTYSFDKTIIFFLFLIFHTRGRVFARNSHSFLLVFAVCFVHFATKKRQRSPLPSLRLVVCYFSCPYSFNKTFIFPFLFLIFHTRGGVFVCNSHSFFLIFAVCFAHFATKKGNGIHCLVCVLWCVFCLLFGNCFGNDVYQHNCQNNK